MKFAFVIMIEREKEESRQEPVEAAAASIERLVRVRFGQLVGELVRRGGQRRRRVVPIRGERRASGDIERGLLLDRQRLLEHL